MMLAVIAQDHNADFSAAVADMCLRSVLPGNDTAQRSSLAARVSSRHPVLLACIRLMNENIETPIPVSDFSAETGCSRRHIERLFLANTGKTPGEYYRGMRLNHARNLLTTTDLPLSDIAFTCGFGSVSNFSRSFRSRFGFAPTKLKQDHG